MSLVGHEELDESFRLWAERIAEEVDAIILSRIIKDAEQKEISR